MSQDLRYKNLSLSLFLSLSLSHSLWLSFPYSTPYFLVSFRIVAALIFMLSFAKNNGSPYSSQLHDFFHAGNLMRNVGSGDLT